LEYHRDKIQFSANNIKGNMSALGADIPVGAGHGQLTELLFSCSSTVATIPPSLGLGWTPCILTFKE
jgi:hypothetical protein